METETFIFQLDAYDVQGLLPQLSRALETRTEMRSREAYPMVWNYVDRFRAFGGGQTRSRAALSIVFLLVGIFLFVPGCKSPETLRVPLVAGAIAIAAGVLGLRRAGRKQQGNRRFERAARMLLAGKETSYKQQGISASFSETEMTVTSNGHEPSHIPYERMESVVEAEDLYLVVYDKSAVILQKRDLTAADPADFSEFLASKIRVYYHVS